MKNATDITIVLDRSGSMQSRIPEVISGFNEFLRSQKCATSYKTQLEDDAKRGVDAFN